MAPGTARAPVREPAALAPGQAVPPAAQVPEAAAVTRVPQGQEAGAVELLNDQRCAIAGSGVMDGARSTFGKYLLTG